MTNATLRDAHDTDFDAIVALNDGAVQHTSAMQRKRLQELAFISSYFKVAAIDRRVVAFLLAMREDAPYTNDNFAWFAARYTRFVYVDRIVVDPACAGMNIGTRLYDDLFDYARKREVETITCEYNVEPPNRASQRFHDRFGFNEVGTRWVTPGKKRVSLQTVDVRQHAATRK